MFDIDKLDEFGRNHEYDNLTVAEKGEKIIELIRELPNIGLGSYRSMSSLESIIRDVMGYSHLYTMYRKARFAAFDRQDCVDAIVQRMRAKNIITLSKRGTTFKLNV